MRTDAHRPAEMRPENYSYRGWIYQGGSEKVLEAICDMRDPDYIDWYLLEQDEGLFYGNWRQKGTCDHCGAHFAWGSVWQHSESGDLVVVGHICAKKFALRDTLELVQRRVSRIREQQEKARKIRESAERFLSDNESLRDVLDQCKTNTHHILTSLQQNLWRWGSLTDKQIQLARKIKEDQRRWAEERVVEGPATDVIEGKGIQITGKIVTSKWKDTDFGMVFKMLVLDDRGFKVWGTVPRSLGDDLDRGTRVRFVANVEASKDDSTFGFFKRPRNAEIIKEIISV